MQQSELIDALYASIGEACITAPDVAHVEIHGNQVLGIHAVPGLTVEADSTDDGIEAKIHVAAGSRIEIDEKATLAGEHATGVLRTMIALRDRARAEIRNTLAATAPYARGHVDCKEIVQDQARAAAIPIVRVEDPRAHVTHEAAIGSVDNKQLESLMARGLDEDEATELIIEGLLGPPGMAV